LGVVEIDRLPAKGRDLAATKAAQGRQHQGNEKAPFPCSSKTAAVEGASIVRTDLRSIFGRSRFSRSAAGLRVINFQRSAWPRAE
jgi:hypothetical protein